MVPLIILLLIIALFGGLGFAIHVLWIVLIVAVGSGVSMDLAVGEPHEIAALARSTATVKARCQTTAKRRSPSAARRPRPRLRPPVIAKSQPSPRPIGP